ncbi:hypothetical protein KVR01_007733 [Diaporthe batatas]|uniref:uncharacterized protein n=1 Tax=Diaporthe batatas TaxID=748121 RepID=UPI001D038055|nr:uncharacterized protein KVR01_007733 [Diaporthe batatas]KAG8161968.1 hypothetical protein KVR01_007733 [Diaporthe batatas]
MVLATCFPLNTGQSIPSVGLGTFQANVGNDRVTEAVRNALDVGYRHFDTAYQYGTEKHIGLAIRESGYSREEIFITSKLWNTWHEPKDVEEALDRSLRDLGTDYVDLYLMHFPHAYQIDREHNALRKADGSGRPEINFELSRNYQATWAAMEGLVRSGKARAIGLANFSITKMKRILSTCQIIPAVNQVELHPLLPQYDLVEFCRRHGILVVAHQPLGGEPVNNGREGHDKAASPLNNATITEAAKQCGITPAQVCLSWAVQRGVPVVPKTVTQARMVENSTLTTLPEDVFQKVSKVHLETGAIRFLNITEKIGFDIFDETEDQPL